jgi:tRNA(Ile)-lysidine synthetase-like protein
MDAIRASVEGRLLEFLRARGLGPGSKLAVAFSGGPDSTALLAALSALGWKAPRAIHVDHGIRDRGELDAELALVRSTCAALGAALVVARLRPGSLAARAERSGLGLEAEARRGRYAALRGALSRHSADAILMAHTRDDQAETLLMRILGGSGAGGLRGIPAASGVFLRPFLELGKAELLKYLEARGLAYSTDSTNVSEDFLRNRVRRRLVPLLDDGFAGWRRGLCAAASKAALDEEALAAAAAGLAFSQREGAAGELTSLAGPLLAAPRALALRALIGAAGSLLGKDRFSSKAAAAALEALRKGGLYRGAGIELGEWGEFARLRRLSAREERGGLDFPSHDGYFVLIDRPRKVRVGPVEVQAEWVSSGRPGIRAGAFSFPIVVRTRRPGDSIATEEGSKRVDALLSEWSLSERARRSAPIVEDRDGIVALLCAGLGGKDRYRARRPIEAAAGERSLSVIVKGA